MRLVASRDLLDRRLRVPGRPPLIGFIGDHQGVLHTLVAVAALLVMAAVLSLVVAVVSHPGAADAAPAEPLCNENVRSDPPHRPSSGRNT
jgi:hypothetical protein